MNVGMKMFVLCMALMLALAGSAFALEIVSPVEGNYTDGNILFNVTHNETLDSIWGSLDSAAPVVLCGACDSFSMMLNLTEGEHTITAYGVLDTENINTSVSFRVVPVNETENNSTENNSTNTTEPSAPNITISKPLADVYLTEDVPLQIEANMVLDSISYRLDNGSYVEACTNCSAYAANLTLAEGNYTLEARGALGNETVDAERAFAVRIPVFVDFSFDVESPLAKTYYDGDIVLRISSNTTLDSIKAEVDGEEFSCTNCSLLVGNLSLEPGNYTLVAVGQAEDSEKEITLGFRVADMSWNTTNKTWSDNSRFSLGFNQLPQAVEAGTISDDELAYIIRNNKLTPGVINRLIKTGDLGNESLDAILDTQFTPNGIWKKLLAFIGIDQSSYADEIFVRYRYREHLSTKLLERDDLGEEELEELKADIAERESKAQGKYGNSTHENNGNALQIGKQDGASQGKGNGADNAGSGKNSASSGGNGNSGNNGNGNSKGNGGNSGSGSSNSGGSGNGGGKGKGG